MVLIAALVLLLYLAGHARRPGALFGLALLLAILNAGLFVEAASARLSALSVAGGLLSWIVLGFWWIEAAAAVALLPALAVVTGPRAPHGRRPRLGAARATARRSGRGFSLGSALGLVAHLFLVAVAADPAWASLPGRCSGCSSC